MVCYVIDFYNETKKTQVKATIAECPIIEQSAAAQKYSTKREN